LHSDEENSTEKENRQNCVNFVTVKKIVWHNYESLKKKNIFCSYAHLSLLLLRRLTIFEAKKLLMITVLEYKSCVEERKTFFCFEIARLEVHLEEF
jgi:hypothetical protein